MARTSRRRLGLSTGVKCPLTEAYARIERLRQNIIYAFVKPTFTLKDVREWLWTDRVWAILTEAYPYVDRGYSPWRGNVQVRQGLRMYITVEIEGVAIPARGTTLVPTDRHPEIVKTIDEILELAGKFDKVRAIVQWLEKNATPGAVRYYWPSACALVPDDHPVNQATNERYREPEGVASQIATFRETAVTVAQALLCPQAQAIPDKGFSISLPDSSTFYLL